MPYTKSTPEVVQALVNLIDTNKGALGIQRVYYGDQDLIPDYPAVCVEGFAKDRTIATTHQFGLTIRAGIMVYHSKVQASEITKKEVEEFMEAVEDVIHSDPTLGGLVIHGFVTRVDPGVAARAQGESTVMIRACRLTWSGLSREVF